LPAGARHGAAVAATLVAPIHPRAEGEVFNISTGIEPTLNRGFSAALRSAWRNPVVRLVAGLAISVVFLAITVSRVDLAETARALSNAAPGGILLAVGFVLVELTIRAERWRILLHPSAPVPLRSAFAYLTIGYFANAVLPARLGDPARAYLAGRSFGISRLVTLGTIVVERVSDALTILIVVLLAGIVVAPGSQLAGSAAVLTAVAVVGAVLAGVVGFVVLRSGILDRGLGRRLRGVVARVGEGAAALRRPRGAALILGLTIVPFGVAVCTFGAVSGALGLPLDPVQWAFVLGVLALSTAIPAAPGSLGTYEFAGVTALGILGIGSSQALAATVLIHVIAALPPALLGLVATLLLHVRIADIEAAGSAPAGVSADG
jgi:glycosyltransferase 2 family protein